MIARNCDETHSVRLMLEAPAQYSGILQETMLQASLI